jgi:ribosome-associated protein
MTTSSAGTKTTEIRHLPTAIQAVISAAEDKKASDIVVMDLRDAGAFTDYFVICSGQTPRQVKAIAEHVEEQLRAARIRPAHHEGYGRAEWVLLDYFDFIVHVFTRETRLFYALDRLWGGAPRIQPPEPGGRIAAGSGVS